MDLDTTSVTSDLQKLFSVIVVVVVVVVVVVDVVVASYQAVQKKLSCG